MDKKLIIPLIALVAVAGLMAGIWFSTQNQPENPGTDAAGKTFTLTVIHGDGSEKTFTITSTRQFLAEALLDEKLIEESDSPGLYIVVDGETADYNVDQSYWGFFVGEDYATEGMNTTVIQDGAVYKLVYSK